MVIGAVVSLVLGYVVLRLVTAGIVLVWETVPESLGSTAAWYVLGVLLIGAVLVYLVRSRLGDTGHSPLSGISVSALTPREYLAAILAILASLFGGVVLGPEVALVSTGAVIGGVVARRMRVDDVTKVVGVSSLGAILALFINPLLSGSLSLDGAPTTIEVDQLGWAIGVALVTTVAVALARLAAALVDRATGSRPHLPVLVGAGLVIGLAALALQAWTGESVLYVVTSGEELISELPTITAASTVVAIIVLKSIAYAVSLGAGFRGGPFFPVMFVGAAVGLLASLVLPEGPQTQAAMIVGVVAAVIATAPMGWRVAIILGAVIGFAMGGWALVPAAVIAAVVSRAVPRWGDRIVSAQHGT
jgi:H+/Cl- antiporter ClcA